MPSPRLTGGLRVAGIVAAATTGVLIGFGLREGDAFRRLELAAAPILGSAAALAPGANVPAVLVGLLVHLAWTVLTGIGFAFAFARLHGAPLMLAATGVAAALLVLQRTWAPWIGGSAPAHPLSLPQAVVLAVTLALALALGMRIALSRKERP